MTPRRYFQLLFSKECLRRASSDTFTPGNIAMCVVIGFTVAWLVA